MEKTDVEERALLGRKPHPGSPIPEAEEGEAARLNSWLWASGVHLPSHLPFESQAQPGPVDSKRSLETWRSKAPGLGVEAGGWQGRGRRRRLLRWL